MMHKFSAARQGSRMRLNDSTASLFHYLKFCLLRVKENKISELVVNYSEIIIQNIKNTLTE